MGSLSLLLQLLATVATVKAAALSIQSPRFTITSSNATELRTASIPLDTLVSPPLTLGPTDTLKLTFQVTPKDGGRGVQPHQTFLRFYDEVSGEEGIQPVRVFPTGKAKYELYMAKPPTSFPPTSTNPLRVSLILGSFTHDPAKFDLFDLYVPESHPAAQHPDEATFHPLPPIEHLFRPEEKAPPEPVSAIFAAIVVSPWLVLLVLLSQVGVRVPHLFSLSILPFTTFLAAFEGLLLWYWVDLKLGQVLLYGAGLGVLTIATGKQALGSIAERRTSSK